MSKIKYREIEGEELPTLLKKAITEAHKHRTICRITHRQERVAIVSAEWIPLLYKLTFATFKKREIEALIQRLNAAPDTKEAANILCDWAKKIT